MSDEELKLTRTQLEQLYDYVNHRDDPDTGGWYYGNKKQFEKQHAAIKDWLTTQIKKSIRRECKCNNDDPLLCHNCEESDGACYCKCHSSILPVGSE